jgi:hypothetical protein
VQTLVKCRVSEAGTDAAHSRIKCRVSEARPYSSAYKKKMPRNILPAGEQFLKDTVAENWQRTTEQDTDFHHGCDSCKTN